MTSAATTPPATLAPNLTFTQIREAVAYRIRVLAADTKSIEDGRIAQFIEHQGRRIITDLLQLEKIDTSLRSLHESIHALAQETGTTPPETASRPAATRHNESAPDAPSDALNEEQKDTIRRRLLLARDHGDAAYQAERRAIMHDYPAVTKCMLNGFLASARNATSGPQFAIRELLRTPEDHRPALAKLLAKCVHGATERDLLQQTANRHHDTLS
ncbi:hypothetical protein HYV74_00840 [Candidatus Uhrbacteria bacterium]|nr:hypothetical protein [Candidatus Uhrbacteria bacterium]